MELQKAPRITQSYSTLSHDCSPIAVPSTVVTRRVAVVCGLTFSADTKRSTDPESSVTWYMVAVNPITVARE